MQKTIKSKIYLAILAASILLIGAGAYGVLATFSPPSGAPPDNDNNLPSLKEIAGLINPNATCLDTGADNYPSLYGLYTAIPAGGCNKGPISNPCVNMAGIVSSGFSGPTSGYSGDNKSTNYSTMSLYNKIGGGTATSESEPISPGGNIDYNNFHKLNIIKDRINTVVAANGYTNCTQYCGDGVKNGTFEFCDDANCEDDCLTCKIGYININGLCTAWSFDFDFGPCPDGSSNWATCNWGSFGW